MRYLFALLALAYLQTLLEEDRATVDELEAQVADLEAQLSAARTVRTGVEET